MATRPVILIHGYSDKGGSFGSWVRTLRAAGYSAEALRVCCYRSLVNELTIPDIAEALDRALQEDAGLGPDEEFDAVVHSTGMLVIRSWLTAYGAEPRRARLKHLIGLAPATFGSPLAHKGRSLLGALAKGSKDPFKPDFLEAGNGVLHALELASPFTWNLAHRDLLGEDVYYGPTRRTPYAFVLCGTEDYAGLRSLVNAPGTDGTVRWAGAALNSRKIVLDFTKDEEGSDQTVTAPKPTNVPVPLIPLPGLNHGTILSAPSQLAVELVVSALAVDSGPKYEAWIAGAQNRTQDAWGANGALWQQFVVRAVDERGDSVEDWNLKLETQNGTRIERFDVDVHVNRQDPSFRCFHVNLSNLKAQGTGKLRATITAASNSRYVGYLTVPNVPVSTNEGGLPIGVYEGTVELDFHIGKDEITFFHPFTTTMIEIRLNREPLPPGRGIKNEVLWWDQLVLDQ
jgi:hypothetical protein